MLHLSTTAQTTPLSGPAPAIGVMVLDASKVIQTLPEIIVTANPLGSADPLAPVERLSGAQLQLRKAATLGETLSGMAGVSSTYFGPNASRPVIRGLDGDRIRVLQNGGTSFDAAALSFDHAVPIEMLAVEAIEVLRGPAALLYGGSAMGGVVNVIDSRIHKTAQFDRKGGFGGQAELRAGGAARERGFGAVLDSGDDRYTLHVDATRRTTNDQAAPIDLACTKPGSPALAKRVCNSASTANGAAIGGSVFFSQGVVGASISDWNTDYGTVAEDEVTIGMRQRRATLEGQWRSSHGPFTSIEVKFIRNLYAHTEFEAGAVGTVFSNRGNELRVQARHAPLVLSGTQLNGVLGFQSEASQFSADGAEAFAPYSSTRERAVFAYEEAKFGPVTTHFGVRKESVQADSLGHPGLVRFVPLKRQFSPQSLAAGLNWSLSGSAVSLWTLGASMSSTQRAPKSTELYADGPHVATGAYEVGNAGFGTEKARALEVSAKWASGPNNVSFNIFSTRFSNYLALSASGNSRGADGEQNPMDTDGDGLADGSGEPILPEFAYQAVPALFKGLELQGQWRLLGPSGASSSAGGRSVVASRASTVDLQWRYDRVSAQNTATSEPLARMAPTRVGLSVVATNGPWRVQVGADQHSAQNRVPLAERATGGYTLWNASVRYATRLPGADVSMFAKLDNATNRLAYSATSVLTQSAPGKAPLPGRGLRIGALIGF